MTSALRNVCLRIDQYVGAAGDPSVQPLGTIAVPLALLQELRRELAATEQERGK